MASHPHEIPMPQALDIQDKEDTLSNISPDTATPARETNEQKEARERKNRAQQAHHNHAQHHREEWKWYQQPAEMLSSNAWQQKLSTTNANNKKKENDNVGSVTPSWHLLHATSMLSSWK